MQTTDGAWTLISSSTHPPTFLYVSHSSSSSSSNTEWQAELTAAEAVAVVVAVPSEWCRARLLRLLVRNYLTPNSNTAAVPSKLRFCCYVVVQYFHRSDGRRLADTRQSVDAYQQQHYVSISHTATAVVQDGRQNL